jgi:hypothetical protein
MWWDAGKDWLRKIWKRYSREKVLSHRARISSLENTSINYEFSQRQIYLHTFSRGQTYFARHAMQTFTFLLVRGI